MAVALGWDSSSEPSARVLPLATYSLPFHSANWLASAVTCQPLPLPLASVTLNVPTEAVGDLAAPSMFTALKLPTVGAEMLSEPALTVTVVSAAKADTGMRAIIAQKAMRLTLRRFLNISEYSYWIKMRIRPVG